MRAGHPHCLGVTALLAALRGVTYGVLAISAQISRLAANVAGVAQDSGSDFRGCKVFLRPLSGWGAGDELRGLCLPGRFAFRNGAGTWLKSGLDADPFGRCLRGAE